VSEPNKTRRTGRVSATWPEREVMTPADVRELLRMLERSDRFRRDTKLAVSSITARSPSGRSRPPTACT
jgi:hypothetical protein